MCIKLISRALKITHVHRPPVRNTPIYFVPHAQYSHTPSPMHTLATCTPYATHPCATPCTTSAYFTITYNVIPISFQFFYVNWKGQKVLEVLSIVTASEISLYGKLASITVGTTLHFPAWLDPTGSGGG